MTFSRFVVEYGVYAKTLRKPSSVITPSARGKRWEPSAVKLQATSCEARDDRDGLLPLQSD